MKKTSPWRVLMIENSSLFDEALKRLLIDKTDLQVWILPYTNEAAFLEDVSDINPEVILLNEHGPLGANHLFELLKTIPILSCLRMIVVRPENNQIDLYEKTHITITQTSDFIRLVKTNKKHNHGFKPIRGGLSPANE